MKIALIAYGTRGDVQPFLSLAWALQERGHNVRLLGPRNAATWIQRAEIPFAEIPVDVQAVFSAEPAQRMLAKGDILSFFRWLAKVEDEYRVAMRRVIIEATSDVDAILTHPLTEDRAAAVGAARGIPVMPVYFYPLPSSAKFPSLFITTRNLGPLNRLTHKLMLDMLWKTSREDVAAMRRELGVAPARDSFAREAQRRAIPCLLTYSEAISPRPADYGGNNFITGDFVMPTGLRAKLGEHEIPPALRQWLDRGSAPVFLGFGSMPVLDADQTLKLIRAALAEIGVRAIIGAGWSNLPIGGEAQLFRVGVVNYEELFPRCAAAVHHGGSGTAHASMRAGLPTLICSVLADNHYWGVRFKKLGVGDTFAFNKLTKVRLAEGLRRVLAEPVRAAAQRLGERIRQENALDTALRVIEHELPKAPLPQ